MTVLEESMPAVTEHEHAVRKGLGEVRVRAQREGLCWLGEAYQRGEFDCEDLHGFLYDIIAKRSCPSISVRLATQIQAFRECFLNPQVGDGVFTVARRHYDLGNDLFSTMLDSSMSYTCGVWANAQTLGEAQLAKLDTICRKLELRPGMTVLDIGCGWGNFAHYAAERYGVSVIGLTVSREQAALAVERCKGLPVEILLKDYRDFEGKVDRVVSIEMIEAVGRKNLSAYYDVIARSLKPDGKCLVQVISTDTFNRRSDPAVDQFVLWLLKYIFPNGYLPTMGELVAAADQGLHIEHIENFGRDYALTLSAWRGNFERGWPALAERYGATFRRMWQFYLAGCEAFFRHNLVKVYQIVYSNRAPLEQKEE